MPHRTLLTPGQIWTPKDRQVSPRKIVEVLKSNIEFEVINSGLEKIQCNHYVFRKWIKTTQAYLAQADENRLSPTLELAQKLFTLRKSVRMSQLTLSKALNISRSAVAALETGRTGDLQKYLPKIAEIFDVPVNFFLDGLSAKPVKRLISSDEDILINLYRALTPEKKINAQKYMERQRNT
ncbi:helix-turn-helix transcriptional regulator (plasmid) [Gluconobacter sphaericus]|uniref:helix-turn-helix domain-containing protein n=1 Tax=Gluconobacter sphaericus TaxID=574987 RepID=UPI001922A3EB|nr:helix-turn-helix transcriptional regulator [Gluconobacter sphaericus]QQX92718.1 helix-turn-helix transcriptional regulator [Gluconobacter sphaericus]